MRADRLQSRRTDRAARRRRGAATVEFAIVCSVMFAFFFAAVEFGRANQVLNAVSNAAYQACRRGIVPGATAAQASAAGQTVLNAALISGGVITISPSTITNTTSTVTVTVSVSLNSNAWVGQSFTKGMTVSRSCTLTREKTN